MFLVSRWFLIVLITTWFNHVPTAKRLKKPKPIKVIDHSMANFIPIVEKTFKFEGGFQQYSTDSANYNSRGELIGTNRGISAIALEEYLGFPPSVADVMAITKELAIKIYKKLFWDKIRGDDLRDQDVADIIFATYIGNPTQSNKIVKKSLAIITRKELDIRNPYSDEIVKTINRADQKKLFYEIKEQKRLFLESLRYSKPEYINGWMNKLNTFEYQNDRKQILIMLVVVAIIGAGSYWAYKKNYHNILIKQVKQWV